MIAKIQLKVVCYHGFPTTEGEVSCGNILGISISFSSVSGSSRSSSDLSEVLGIGDWLELSARAVCEFRAKFRRSNEFSPRLLFNPINDAFALKLFC